MLSSLLQKFIYPAPSSSYTSRDFEGCLCWIPWNETVATSQRHPSSVEAGCQPQQAVLPGTPPNLPCLWLPAKRSASVLLYFHANAEDLGVVHSALMHLQKQLQISVLAMEYPGYGLLKDFKPSEEVICAAAMVALRYLVSEVGIPYSQVMLLGRSLGGSPAIYLASRFPVGGLLLVNPFTSLAQAAEGHIGKSFSHIAFGSTWNNEAIIGNVSCAVLFIHAAKDRTVPMEHSARLFQKCRSRKLLITPEGMEHNSHLFADPQFLAVPAIHFFHFPCYQTDNPPSLPPHVFKPPIINKDQKREDAPVHQWSCSGRQCNLKAAGEDEVAVPVGSAVLGEVDVADKMTAAASRVAPKQSIAQRMQRGVDQGSLPKQDVGEDASRMLPARCLDTSKPVAPGDESAGWPTAKAMGV